MATRDSSFDFFSYTCIMLKTMLPNEHTTVIRLAYLELLGDLLNEFFALLFFLLKSLLFGFKEFLVPAFSVFQTFRGVYRMQCCLGLVSSHGIRNAHKSWLLSGRRKQGLSTSKSIFLMSNGGWIFNWRERKLKKLHCYLRESNYSASPGRSTGSVKCACLSRSTC